MSLKKIAVTALASGILIPAAAFAQTTSPGVQTLLDQIKTLQAKIAELQGQQKTLIQERNDTVQTLLNTLKQGAEGDDVKVLQALLAADADVYPEGRITGFFGPLTALAVKRFQKKHDLEQVGHVGPRTLKKLNELLGTSPIAFEHSSSTPGVLKRPCVPPGHLIAPGWLKKHGNDPIVPPCKDLPPGIAKKLPGTGTTTPPTPDTTAPTISSVLVSGISSTTATVSWTTNESAAGKVYYATSSSVSFSSAWTLGPSSATTSHSFTLSSLTASTTYYYVVESKDVAGNTATTSTASFLTL